MEKYITELPVLRNQATRDVHSGNLNCLEHLSICLDDSPYVLSLFLSRWEKLNNTETLTATIKMLLGEHHSIHTRIFNTIVIEHDFMLNSKHPPSLPLAKPICTGIGRSRL